MAARRKKGSVRSVLQHRLQDGSLLGAYTGRVKTAAAKNAQRIESMLDIAIITKQSCEVMHAVLIMELEKQEGAVTTNEYSYASARLFSGGYMY